MNPYRLKVLSVCSGIGGLDLGAHWTDCDVVAYCEADKFCQDVLRARFGKDVVIFDDLRTLTGIALRERRIGRVDIICGGFPCTDVSIAGKGAGITGVHSGLWSHIHRLL